MERICMNKKKRTNTGYHKEREKKKLHEFIIIIMGLLRPGEETKQAEEKEEKEKKTMPGQARN